jgi:hypothetical protein
MTNEKSVIALSWTELTSRRTEYRSPSPTVRVFLFYPLPREYVFGEQLSRNDLPRLFVVAGTCLASRCLATDFHSHSTIPAFRRHVTLCCVESHLTSNIPNQSLFPSGFKANKITRYCVIMLFLSACYIAQCVILFEFLYVIVFLVLVE